MGRKIPGWVARGTLGSILLAILAFVLKTVLELKIQNAYEGVLEPYFTAPIEVHFVTNRFQMILLALSILALVILFSFVITRQVRSSIRRRNATPSRFKPPQNGDDMSHLTSTDVVHEIVMARQGRTNPENAAKVVVKAVNFKVITPEAGAEALEEFGYALIELSDGRYTVGIERGNR